MDPSGPDCNPDGLPTGCKRQGGARCVYSQDRGSKCDVVGRTRPGDPGLVAARTVPTLLARAAVDCRVSAKKGLLARVTVLPSGEVQVGESRGYAEDDTEMQCVVRALTASRLDAFDGAPFQLMVSVESFGGLQDDHLER